ncbi:hypothetical protein SAMN05428966_10439 [Massilia sp. PDC64]|nr:DUF5946 family protein [Massilia sp. PDC64]SDD33193.1 hypothetical protein SAMN05428966_10439 [Massilia sp. PDC64]
MIPSPNTHRCPECGATYAALDDHCAARFDVLLALDHSHREPWGSRHGQAFAAYALQHPATHAASLDRAWLVLRQIYVSGMAPDRVFGALVAARGRIPPGWDVPARAARQVHAPAVTIADLGDFDAATYAGRLDDWCRAALASWGAVGA